MIKPSRQTADWNELEFLSWKEFQQMAPSIIQLEITRLGQLTVIPNDDTDIHNALVKARFELTKLGKYIASSDKNTQTDVFLPYLSNAILNITAIIGNTDSETRQILDYVLDRLHYVSNRIRLIY